jgi:hypothetical protein
MIQCETCNKWQHGECMGYEDPDEVNDEYECEVCRPDLYKDVGIGKKKPKETKKKAEPKAEPKEKPVRPSILKKN